MKRRLFLILSALSLLLCVAVAALWLRSHWYSDVLTVWTGKGSIAVGSTYGDLWLERSNFHGTSPSFAVASFPIGSPPDSQRRSLSRMASYRFGRFIIAADSRPAKNVGLDPAVASQGLQLPTGLLVRDWINVPVWAVFVLAAIASVPGFWPYLRRRDRVKGHCPSCGYDLRATPDRCPECGQTPAPNPATVQ